MVGAGVVGLTAAVRLAEQGLDVNVLARDLPAETTSALADGLWLPEPVGAGGADRTGGADHADDGNRADDDHADHDDHADDGDRADEPDRAGPERSRRWAARTLTELLALAQDPDSGVRVLPGYLLRTSPTRPPAWARLLPDGAHRQARTDPAPGYRFGDAVSLPVVDPPAYLAHLRGRLHRADGTLTRLPLAGLPPRGIVVNCTGLSARALVPDLAVRPVRAQVVLLTDPGLTHWYRDPESADRSLSVLPRGDRVVVGGPVQDGIWDTAPDLVAAEDLLLRARAAVPALADARVLGHRVGLRPARTGGVRLEVERAPGASDPGHAVVHCYGHGGQGLTLSWGCADDVLQAVGSLVAA